jgi:beta-lactamase class A
MVNQAQVIPIVALLLIAGRNAGAEETLESRLAPLVAAHQGDVAVMVKHLATGERYEHRADVPQPTASLIKFPVMVEAYRQSREEQLDLGQMVTLTEADKVPGSGILTPHFSPGARLALGDCIRLMIAYSDNTATNLLLDRIGIDATARTMEQLGFPSTKIHSKVFRRDTSVFPERSRQFGLGSTTAAEMIGLLELLHQEKLVSRDASRQMLAHLQMCDDKLKFPRLLPEGTKLAFKTGSVSDARTAAGILETPAGPVALCVLTARNSDQRWSRDNAADLLCAHVALRVYEHYRAPKPAN